MTIVGACSTAARTDGRVDARHAAAMDDLKHVSRTAPDQRERQFLRLRDRIEQCASRKFIAREFEDNPPRFILRGIDFPNSFGQAFCSRDLTRFCTTKLVRRFARAAGRGARAGHLCLRQPKKNMIIARLLMIGLSLLTTSPVFATTELCRSIGADKERLACFDREASPVQASKRQAKAAEETTGSKFVDPVESLKTENDKVSARLKGICHRC
jgi:hypothetical protein